MLYSLFCFFFFKQKTAYEMRISDWSSDVCSSDLPLRAGRAVGFAVDLDEFFARHAGIDDADAHDRFHGLAHSVDLGAQVLRDLVDDLRREIGRASCRERVCQYV